MEYQLIVPKVPQENLTAAELVLINRGIAPEDLYHYTHTSDKDILDPSKIQNMQKGAQILVRHMAQNDDILIIVDSDNDGLTSSAILINYLYKIAPSFTSSHVSYRLHEGKQHGLSDQISYISSIENKLIICPDAGSSDYDEIMKLKELGKDILIIDHHLADKITEEACIINNQLCDYPSKSLSGAGMVYKFCSYLDKLLNKNYADHYLDLTAVGCIGDMVDLKDFELRQIINKGLKNIQNPFLNSMIEKQSFSMRGEINPTTIAFYIVPYINAMIRSGTYEEKNLLFKAMIESESYKEVPSTKRGCRGQMETVVEQACRTCTNVKSRQTKSRDASVEYVEELIEKNNLLSHKLLIVKLEKDIDKNLVGLIANELQSKYGKPTILLNKTYEDDKIIWSGSARNVRESKIYDFRQFLLDTNLVEFAQGHSAALGCAISDENFNEFVQYTDSILANIEFSPIYRVDFIYANQELTPKAVLDIAGLKDYWGQGIEESLIAIENINITKENVALLSKDKNPTLKITLSSGISLIKFRSSVEEYERLCSDTGCITINIVGKCKENIWNGNIYPQIQVEEYEIVGSKKYYF